MSAPRVWTWLLWTGSILSLQIFMLLPVVQSFTLAFFSVLLLLLQTSDACTYSLPTGSRTWFIASITPRWYFWVMIFKPWVYLVILLTLSQTNKLLLLPGKTPPAHILHCNSKCSPSPQQTKTLPTHLTTSRKQSTYCATPQLRSTTSFHPPHEETADPVTPNHRLIIAHYYTCISTDTELRSSSNTILCVLLNNITGSLKWCKCYLCLIASCCLTNVIIYQFDDGIKQGSESNSSLFFQQPLYHFTVVFHNALD